jgi:hypothetical protein
MLAAACSGGGTGDTNGASGASSPSAQEAEPKLSVAYSALTTKVGDTVALSAHLENARDAVVWSVSGPGALSAASGNEVLYQATEEGTAGVVASAAGLTSAISIKVLPGPGSAGSGSAGSAGSGSAGSAGSGSASSDSAGSGSAGSGSAGSGSAGSGSAASGSGMTPTCSTADVKGRVLNNVGDPVVNQAVFVIGDPRPATGTDGDGKFTITGVTPPYDLAIVEDASNRVFVYKGLTRLDPTLYVFTQMDQTDLIARTATVNVTLTGGDSTATVAAPDVGFVGFGSNEVRMPWDLTGQTWGPFPFSFPLPAVSVTENWNSPMSDPGVTTGTLVGLEYQPDPVTGAPRAYWYDHKPSVTLLDGAASTQSLALVYVTGVNTQGTITLPPHYALTKETVALSLEKDVFFPVFSDFTLLPLNFNYTVPDIQDANTQVCARAEYDPALPFANSFSYTCIDALEPQSAGAQLKILDAPQPWAPMNNATSVDMSTNFKWSEFKGGVHFVQITPVSPNTASNPTYFIFTKGTSTTVPDLTPAGGTFGVGDYTWNVSGFAPFASMDAFTADIPAPTLYQTVVGSPSQDPVPPVPNASTGQGITYKFTAKKTKH